MLFSLHLETRSKAYFLDYYASPSRPFIVLVISGHLTNMEQMFKCSPGQSSSAREATQQAKLNFKAYAI